MFLLSFIRIVFWQSLFNRFRVFCIFCVMYVGLNIKLLDLNPNEVINHLWGSMVENLWIRLLILSIFVYIIRMISLMTYLILILTDTVA